MTLSRIELADCGTPEALVVGILKQAEIPIPIPIESIARELDISEIREIETDGFEGALIAFEDKRSGTILVNKRSNRQRQRFTVGHELCHFLSPWHTPTTSEGFRCTAKDMSLSKDTNDRAIRIEVEANRFSAGLLLPLPYFRKDLVRLKKLDVQHIPELAAKYDASKDATARRYAEENDEPCAAVVSRNGVILRIYRNKSFPFVDLANGTRLPPQTATSKVTLREGTSSDWIAVDGGVWFDSKRGSRSRTVYEQVLIQQSGFRLTLLSLDEDRDEEENEDELRSRWEPRFHRR